MEWPTEGFRMGRQNSPRLAAKTPGTTNAPIRSKSMVINEIMYHPISDDDNDEYIELYNRGPGSMNLSGWRFTDGIDFTFPTNTIVASNGYLVVAKNAARMSPIIISTRASPWATTQETLAIQGRGLHLPCPTP